MALKNIFLFTVFLFASALSAAAQEPDAEEPKEKLKILFEFAPDALVFGEPFTLTIVVNQTNPDEILVEPPDFNEAFRIEQLRTEARIVQNGVRGGDRWTVFEFMLMALEPGTHELGAFTVSTPEETVLTNPINVDVREAKSDFVAALAWFGENGLSMPPARASVGSPREAVLRITRWPTGKPYPADGLPLRIEPPQNAIVEYVPLTENDRKKGFVLRLRITAIEGRFVNIDSRFARYRDLSLEIPALRIAVQPAPPAKTVAAAPDEEPAAAETEAAGTPQPIKPVSFSDAMDGTKKIFSVFRTGPENCLATSESLWTRGLYAEALASLRHGERSLTAAYLVKTMRKTCEDALGLPVGPDETHLPAAPLSVVSALLTPVAVILFFIRKKARVPAFCIAASAIIALSALSLLAFSHFDGMNRAVLKRCAAYLVPEETVKSLFFPEGEPVIVRSRSASWLYVERAAVTAVEKSGWIKKDNAVPVTARRR
jgi:hypothetical protein